MQIFCKQSSCGERFHIPSIIHSVVTAGGLSKNSLSRFSIASHIAKVPKTVLIAAYNLSWWRGISNQHAIIVPIGGPVVSG